MSSRHSGDQAHKVDFSPHCTKRGRKGKKRVPARVLAELGKLRVAPHRVVVRPVLPGRVLGDFDQPPREVEHARVLWVAAVILQAGRAQPREQAVPGAVKYIKTMARQLS